jgi:hypothetical protein
MSRAWSVTAFRVLATCQALLTLLQPILAGRFLSGDFESLLAHRANANALGVVALVQVGVAMTAWRRRRLPSSMVTLSLILLLLITIQIGLGYTRLLAVHIPLGVAIVAGSAGVASRAWRQGTPASPDRAEPNPPTSDPTVSNATAVPGTVS